MKLEAVPKAPSECWSLLQPSEAGRRQAARTPKGFAKISDSYVSFMNDAARPEEELIWSFLSDGGALEGRGRSFQSPQPANRKLPSSPRFNRATGRQS